MRIFFIAGAVVLACLAGVAAAHDLPECYDPETAALREVKGDELTAHGGYRLGPVDYPAGTTHVNFAFSVAYVVDETGHVSCISTGESGPPFKNFKLTARLTPQRQALLDRLAATVFTPFITDGKAEKVRVENDVDEQELPASYVAPPLGDPTTAVIQLDMSGHRTPYHTYSMTIIGDGTVHFDPAEYWLGKKGYRIAPEKVQTLLDMAKTADFWSLKNVYLPEMEPDKPEFYSGHFGYFKRVTITLGGRTKSVSIYDWGNPGAPLASRHLMDDMAVLAGRDIWYEGVHTETISLLAENGFDFTSKKGGQLLVEATATHNVSDTEIYGLIARGTPQDFVYSGYFILDTSFIDAAISARRSEMVDNLIKQGTLLTNSKPDPIKVTRAYAKAASIGASDIMLKIAPFHPALVYHQKDVYAPGKTRDEVFPIITLANTDGFDPPLADRIAVIQQLLDAGADINSRDSNGESLLDQAAGSAQGDDQGVDYVRWLLAHGAVADAFVLLSLYDEDLKIQILEAGIALDAKTLSEVVIDAEAHHDDKVIAWLKAHGKWPADTAVH